MSANSGAMNAISSLCVWTFGGRECERFKQTAPDRTPVSRQQQSRCNDKRFCRKTTGARLHHSQPGHVLELGQGGRRLRAPNRVVQVHQREPQTPVHARRVHVRLPQTAGHTQQRRASVKPHTTPVSGNARCCAAHGTPTSSPSCGLHRPSLATASHNGSAGWEKCTHGAVRESRHARTRSSTTSAFVRGCSTECVVGFSDAHVRSMTTSGRSELSSRLPVSRFCSFAATRVQCSHCADRQSHHSRTQYSPTRQCDEIV